ncbi:MAG: hypothetical protein Q7T26_03375 [Dehalococcoidia bacterium]|nr:hypothetical protein [Dehalococcoidia bacterium]
MDTEMSADSLWTINRDKTGPHWLELNDPEGWYHATVKWDGCIDFARYFNLPFTDPSRREGDCDVLHICELDDLLGRLQELKTLAQQHFTDHEEWQPDKPEA